MPRVRVCVCVRVCAFFPFALIPGRGNLSCRQRLQAVSGGGKIACLLRPLFTISLLVAYKGKSGEAFIYCFACFLMAIFTIVIHGRDADLFQCIVSPNRSHLFFGQVVLYCREWNCGASFAMHSGCFFCVFFLNIISLLELPLWSFYTSISLPKHICESRLCSPAAALGCCFGS